MKQALPPAIFLMGPTASGKTGVAVELVQRLPLEIVSVDSALVYRDMNIGTAKPDTATLALAPHHLIDLIDPTQSYSAAQFTQDALAAMRDITARGKVPFLVGGTMLYFKALREGLSDLPSADLEVRAEIEAEAKEKGWPALHGELARVDPVTAARLQPTDAQRISRALEVYRQSGEPMSQYLLQASTHSLPYRALSLALMPGDRAVLHARIADRFDLMLQQGLVEETESLRQRYVLTPQMPSMRCVGYRQAWQFLEGEFGIEELRNRGIYATRQLAKRQITWLRAMPDKHVVDSLHPTVLSLVQADIETHLMAS